MKTASTKLLNEEYAALKTYCENHDTNISAILSSAIKEILKGRIKPRRTGMNDKIPFCPHCGFALYPNFRDKSWNCLRCGYFSYISDIPSFQEGEKLKI